MGFETYLQIDDEILLMWRKHASYVPRVLFRFSDLHIEPFVDDGEPVIGVVFRTTAARALANLENAGLGWHAAVAAYADIRVVGGFSTGWMIGHFMNVSNGESRSADIEREITRFEQLSAEHDLVNLGTLMSAEWRDPGSERVSLLSDMTYDGDLPNANSSAMRVWESAQQRGIPDPFSAARAAESLAYLDRTAPMLLWPLVMCLFLRHISGEAVVELTLTDDAARSGGVTDAPAARDYATAYWSDASEALAREARTLQRLFAVLAESGAGTGAEFWFARAADLLARVKSLRTSSNVTTRARGDALESLVEALIRTEEPELQVLEKNLRTTEEEIDLVLRNGLRDPFWSTFSSPLILVECKNWSKAAGVPELRVFESKLRDRGALCRIGIFVSLSGFTKPFLTRLKAIQAADGVILAVDGSDLSVMVEAKTRITEWLADEGLRRALSGTS